MSRKMKNNKKNPRVAFLSMLKEEIKQRGYKVAITNLSNGVIKLMVSNEITNRSMPIDAISINYSHKGEWVEEINFIASNIIHSVDAGGCVFESDETSSELRLAQWE